MGSRLPHPQLPLGGDSLTNSFINRLLVVTTVSLGLVLAVMPARAHHRDNAYCSESGALCQRVKRSDGKRKLTITLAERYFGRYILCVGAEGSAETCLRFRIEKRSNGRFRDRVGVDRFPDVGRGRYSATWYRVPRQGPPTKRIGRRLGFHIR